ncbi:MAG: cbb3-type cytochrome c oxidase subunit I [Verrucomicrobiae bacterium]|nr:cbb3-type cytochrome c oxidase subunit I [Verrucomicrobiae bacterium]
MNPADTNQVCSAKIDASCRVPLLALFGGAALWLVLGLAFALIASLTFHNPEILAYCPCLTYGHTLAAANNLLVYGFAIPAALGVILWIFARLSQAELVLPIVPVAAANLWHLGVFVGVATIFGGGSSGYTWLEFPRAAAALLGVSFVLVAISAVATFGQRQERELYPSHWFLLAALLWFPWIYSTSNLFLGSNHPVRGVAQGVINWWYADNLVFVWLALVGLGTAFYFIPKISGQPLKSRFYALFAFWTLILFGTWIGIPAGAPVPAWLPTTSALASYMLIIPIIAVAVVLVKTLWGAKVASFGGIFCYMRFGTVMFLISALMLVVQACPKHGSVLEFTWFGQAQVQLQILGFVGLILCGAIHDILPQIMSTELPFKKFVQVQFWLSFAGLALYIIPLAVAGVMQGNAVYDPAAAKVPLMICTSGLMLLLAGAVLLLVNILVMTFKWKIALAKSAYAAVTAPLESSEVKS